MLTLTDGLHFPKEHTACVSLHMCLQCECTRAVCVHESMHV